MNMNMNIIIKEWLNDKEKELKQSSYDRYENVANNHLLPFLSNQSIDCLNYQIINDFLQEKKDTGLSANMINFIRIALKSLYNYAEKKLDLVHIDFNQVKKYKDEEKKMILDDYEIDFIYDYCVDHIDDFSLSILLSLYMGLQTSELCALQYQDLNIDEAYLSINKRTHTIVNREDKTSKSLYRLDFLKKPEERKLILPDFMIDFLKKYIQDCDDDCYLLNHKKTFPLARTYQRRLKEFGDRNNIDVNYVILRNTCRSIYLHSNVDINLLFNVLGTTCLHININEIEQRDKSFYQNELKKLKVG